MEYARKAGDAVGAARAGVEATTVPLAQETAAPSGAAGADPVVELENLRRRLATLPVIEQSKGILMGAYGIDADAAFNVLRRWSQANNVKLVLVSEALVAAAAASEGHLDPLIGSGTLAGVV